ncbi:MAG: NmrA family NAD(P)-binding protein [Leptolyngbyaceae cyanobacterium RM2_2_4]|nr:NmrA family NAD(P)-binding protein [Leptolyngbyaceae cyanobacterium SM1_4_3]NJN90024.1 NmrA family NAD(P)-binding protein [Leptolyngbyaceae cyanobacterium SL_5_14]NJO50283.1 NmrA family NAD(P)-binding protein [Leptolyngbyaceae cyanobacterium RM2_2_4]
MHIILGGTGHVGSAVAQTLLSQDEPVTIVSRSSSSISGWQKRGAQVEVVDVHNTAELRCVFARGKRLFLLNPPADPATNTDVEERKSLASILAAIKDSGLEKIVAESTYGAQPGSQIGDLGVLYEMEQHLAAQSMPFSIIRAAYYMSNWNFSLRSAKQDSVINTFFPADFALPMVAPRDIGQLAARLMTEPVENIGLYNIEGPERYSSLDVAKAFAKALQTPVKVVETPRDQWIQTMKNMGFSNEAASSFSNMTTLAIEGEMPTRNSVIRGVVSLESYIAELVHSVV